MNTDMNINGLKCTLNLPDASKIKSGQLPPYSRQPAYLVEEYEGCPANWMHGSAKASSYFVGVEKGKALWLDFNSNCYHKKDLAIVISIQGVNPITGMKTDSLRLEQYIEKCPRHAIEFGSDRFCEKCKYKWPKQNYLSSSATPSGYLWLDGFRTLEGIIQQYVFTDDVEKGVAAQIIGNERVYAIGIAFFESKEDKKQQPTISYQHTYIKTWSDLVYRYRDDFYPIGDSSYGAVYSSYGAVYSSYGAFCRSISTVPQNRLGVMKNLGESEEKTSDVILEIGAGQTIKQTIYDDPHSLDHYNNEVAGMLYINYVSKAQLENILKTKCVAESGFLEGLKTC